MNITHSGPYNTVYTQDENGHRVPYTWSSADIPQDVADYVAEHKLWTKAVKAQYAKDHPPKTQEQIDTYLVQTADSFVTSEMDIADKAINAHDEGASRIISTKTKWINYKNKLRDYVQLVNGVRKIIISKPTRPS